MYFDSLTRSLRLATEDGDAAVGGGGGGTTDHAALTNRAWTSSGHTGTASSLAGFDSGGAAAAYYPPDLEIRCDANPTLATGYEIVRGYLRTAHQYTTTTARTIASTSPEYGWTWANRTNLTTADENTTTANATYGKVTTANCDWAGGTYTNPNRYQTLAWSGEMVDVIGLFYSNGAANYECAGILVYSDTNNGIYLKCGVGAAGGSVALHCYDGSGLATASTTTAERNAGVWLRFLLFPTGSNSMAYAVLYNKTASSSPPTSWTVLQRSSIAIAIGTTMRIGQMWQTANTAGNLTGGCKWFGIQRYTRQYFEATSPAFFHGRQYNTTAAAQTLIASYDFGTSSAAISDTELRAALAAAENHMDDDSGASWTYSAVRGSSPSPAAGSYSAAASVSVSGTGRYFALYAKCTSDGATHGSFNVGGFRLRATV